MDFNELPEKEKDRHLRQYSAPDLNLPGVKKLIDIIISTDSSGVSSGTDPIKIPVHVKDGLMNQCVMNVRNRCKRDGGSASLGWLITYQSCFIAHLHVVWRQPNGVPIDITPIGDGNTGLVLPINEILFLPAINPTITGKTIIPICFNVDNNPLVDDMMDWWKIYARAAVDLELCRHEASGCITGILQMLGNGLNSYDSPCFCGNRWKYKDCHKQTLEELMNRHA